MLEGIKSFEIAQNEYWAACNAITSFQRVPQGRKRSTVNQANLHRLSPTLVELRVSRGCNPWGPPLEGRVWVGSKSLYVNRSPKCRL